MDRRIPTVNDLRVKLCYICREEERFDAEPEDHPKIWTHPCVCTLVAHESCLLHWIQTTQGDSSRAPNALKCPQCGSQYELESNRPMILRILASGNKTLQRVGRMITLFSAVGCVVILGSGIFVLSTGYGAWALKQFIGREMFDIILTDDPSNWPWTAFLNLPILPFTLILSRLQSTNHLPSIIPMLLVWPPSSPVGVRQRLLDGHWRQPPGTSALSPTALPSLSIWPPSPIAFGFFVVPFVRVMYRRMFSRLQYWALGAKPILSASGGGRFLWQLNEGGPFMIRIRANVDRGAAQEQEQEQEQPAPEAANPVPLEPDAAAVAAAEQLIEIDTSSLGRRVGGALLIPAISSMMGSLLFRLSKRSHLLRKFLGVRPSLGLLSHTLGPYAYDHSWHKLGFLQQLKLTLRLVMSATWNGSRIWAEADPVWWRNSIGLGLFIAAKDCVQLLHLWLAKRELETRRVKNRDFGGIDIQELDLIPSFFQSQ